jgi:hypothetical protein
MYNYQAKTDPYLLVWYLAIRAKLRHTDHEPPIYVTVSSPSKPDRPLVPVSLELVHSNQRFTNTVLRKEDGQRTGPRMSLIPDKSSTGQAT